MREQGLFGDSHPPKPATPAETDTTSPKPSAKSIVGESSEHVARSLADFCQRQATDWTYAML